MNEHAPATPPDWYAPQLVVRSATPAWFDWALAQPLESRYVTIAGCPIHYLLWPGEEPRPAQRGLLFVHGGGAHANWWRFIAPFFGREFRVAALDLSGMGDSGRRETYDAGQRAEEILGVLEHAGLGAAPFVVGHSFGGYMAMRFCANYGARIGGAVIVDSPIRRPGPEDADQVARRALSLERYYPSFDSGVERFRLLPPQDCANDFIVEFIARHSLRETPTGWTWKFDVNAMGTRRWSEPFKDHLCALGCRAALIYGELSALVSRDTAAYMGELMGPAAPIIEIPQARHHLMLDQPLAFVAALRSLLAGWIGAEHAGTTSPA